MKKLLIYIACIAFTYVGVCLHNKTFDWYAFDKISGSILGVVVGMGGIIWISSYQKNDEKHDEENEH
jgi:hypothetical protein